jgi:predicted nucleotidyltransferase component of viral defense system
MIKDICKQQVALLIDILIETAKENSFALHGGTAINLFHLNMPRLSIDIDLTFIPFSDDRTNDLNAIRESLESIKNRVKTIFPSIRFENEKRAGEELKLLCSKNNVTVKVEVNQINRGLIANTCTKILCSRAEEEFNRFCEIKTVSVGQLWGGKLNAALERQHPRDIFDVKNMLKETGFTEEIKQGFLFFLLCSKRPINEILQPNYIDQRVIFESQFTGMTNEYFSYEEFEKIREELVPLVNNSLSVKEKEFILSFVKGNPHWEQFDYSNFPAIKWKLLNISKLKHDNYNKYWQNIEKLEKIFNI